LKKKTLSIAILSMVLILAMLSVIPDVEAFGSDHRTITDGVLKKLGFSDKAKERVIDANEAQDGIWCYGWLCPGTSNTETPDYHGDRLPGETSRQAFDRLRKYINDQKELAKKLIKECKTKKAQDALGRALHALQDFYSHSNFVDKEGDPPKDVFDETEKKDIQKSLTDPSYNSTALPKLKMTGWGTPKTDDYRHKEKAKDSKKSPLGKDAYEAAKSAATQHTEEFVKGIEEQLEKEDPEALKKLKGDPPPPPPPSDQGRTLPGGYMPPGHFYQNHLYYSTSWAVSLTILEGLPNGAVFVSSVPTPYSVESATLETPDNPPITLVQWRFVSGEPLGVIEINYTIEITEEAITHPSVAWRCRDTEPGYILFHGEIEETDINGTQYRSNIGGQQFAQIGGVGGVVIPVDKFGLLAPYIGLASTIIVATVATSIYVKHVKRRKEK